MTPLLRMRSAGKVDLVLHWLALALSGCLLVWSDRSLFFCVSLYLGVLLSLLLLILPSSIFSVSPTVSLFLSLQLFRYLMTQKNIGTSEISEFN